MVLLTKINNAQIAVNSDLVQYIEETPDTVITMTTGDKVVVQERMTEIIERIVQYRRLISGLVESAGSPRVRALDVSRVAN